MSRAADSIHHSIKNKFHCGSASLSTSSLMFSVCQAGM